ncbi:hypothetical protein [Solidesulfovibrio magneticus]|uniref:Uncharacterized protein n=1 Tax=Solidesulfovibrio magneticus (strain ATCC 700980 / DSM 13731 / RS-1) TaxID=573370 RepID=C4XJ38_SOLM1|nr:hypothetical protein [Solidesulfovibrio magneticus]BAH74202.1 hypothetical protein DMR_07110 [Solidesulfovibrio magneticus RS-1]
MTKPIFSIHIGQFASMYDLHLAAVVALRKAGLEDHARELRQRGMDVPSWHDMLALIGEYLDVDLESCRRGRG